MPVFLPQSLVHLQPLQMEQLILLQLRGLLAQLLIVLVQTHNPLDLRLQLVLLLLQVLLHLRVALGIRGVVPNCVFQRKFQLANFVLLLPAFVDQHLHVLFEQLKLSDESGHLRLLFFEGLRQLD